MNFREGRIIKKRFLTNLSKNDESLSKRFINLMFMGIVNAALNLISNVHNQGVLPLSDEVISVLKQKHPTGEQISLDLLLVHYATFNNLDADTIQKAALGTKGVEGPSHLDAENWRRIPVSKNFGTYNTDLCKAVTKMAKIMCTEQCDRYSGRCIESFQSCTLIPLDKSAVVRPIGIR